MKGSILLVLGVLFLALVSCNDKSALLTTSDDAPTQLAAESARQVTLRTRTGDGPLIERLVTPVRWDGVSELRSGVVYRWNNYEEALAAYQDRRPEKYRVLKELSESRKLQGNGYKVKAGNETALAYDPYVSANVWRIGDYDTGRLYTESSIWQPELSSPATVSFYLLADGMLWPAGPIYYLEEIDTTFTNTQESHSLATLTHGVDCPAVLGAFARLYVSNESPNWWVEGDDEVCGWH